MITMYRDGKMVTLHIKDTAKAFSLRSNFIEFLTELDSGTEIICRVDSIAPYERVTVVESVEKIVGFMEEE